MYQSPSFSIWWIIWPISNCGLFFFYFFSDLPNFWHVSYKLIGKHFSLFFSRWFFLFPKYNICKKKMLEEQKASFVSPSTKELQRKPLGNLTFFAYVILKRKRKPVEKIQRNVLISICSSHTKNLKFEKKNSPKFDRLDMPPALQLF